MTASTFGSHVATAGGPAAATLGRWTIASGGSAAVLMIGMFVGMLVNDTGYLGHPALAAMMAGAIACGVVLVVVYPWGYVVERREARLGYTTYPRFRKDLVQVDPRTRRVIRPAHEPFLDRATRRERAMELRS